ncbi:TolC family protein [Thalassoglobus sp.]|uniref:TolC family protein n=1 Tax=Thalassoglobus sp. TaxID=2795869 RepID=UPI003AA9CBD4
MTKSPYRRRILSIGLVPFVGLGCASARTQVAQIIMPAETTSQVVAAADKPTTERPTLELASPSINSVDATPSSAEQIEIEVVNHQSELNQKSNSSVEPAKLPPAPPASSIPEQKGLTLQALEELALQNNPSIQQANAVAAKASGIHYQVGRKPNPSIGYFGEEIGNDGAGGLHGAFVSQTFVRGDKLAWNEQVIGHDVESIRWQTEAQRQRVRTDIRIQFYEALAAQKRLELARDFRDIAEKGVEVSQQRVDAQVGTRPDVLQSEIQQNEVELIIQQAEYDFESAWKQLAAIAGVPGMETPTLSGKLQPSDLEREADALYQQIVSQSPLISAAQARVHRAQANMQRQNVQAIPNINGQFGVGRDDGTGDAFANIQLSLPIPYNNKNTGNISAAHGEYCEATQNVQRLKMQIRQNLAIALRDYQVAQANVQRYQSAILPKAQETLDLVQEAQLAGEFDFLRVLTARRAYFDANLNYVRSLGNLATANARIEGLLLTGGLSNTVTYDGDDGLRGQALSGQ